MIKHESIVDHIHNQMLAEAKEMLNEEKYETLQKELAEFWSENFKLFAELETFQVYMDAIVLKVIKSAIARKAQGKPAMRDQSCDEHLEHMKNHLNHWERLQKDDEDSVEEQASHTLCRAMLAFFTFVFDDKVLEERIEELRRKKESEAILN